MTQKDKRQEDESRIKIALEYANNIIATLREPFLVLDKNLQIISANEAFYTTFEVAEKDAIGRLLPDLGNRQWNIPKLLQLLKEIIPEKKAVKDYEIEHKFEKIGERVMLLNACPLRVPKKIAGIIAIGVREEEELILLAIEDITERREIEKGLEKTRKELAATKISEDAAHEYSKNIINTVREPLIVLDQDLRVVFVSRSFYEFFKVKPEETVGQLIYNLGNKQWDIPKLRELLETVLPQKTTFDNYEVEHDFATIGRRIMLLNARQIERVLGKERIILLAIEDITEHRQVEEALQDSEAKYRVLFEHSADGILIVDLETKVFKYANPAMCRMLGYTGDELKTLGVSNVHPKDALPYVMAELGSQIGGEKTLAADIPCLRKDGTIFYADSNATTIAIDGRKCLVEFCRDITKRKRAEQELMESKALVEAVVENIPLMLFLKEATGLRFVMFNRAGEELLGYDRKALLGKNNLDLFPPEQAAHFMAKDREVLDGEAGILDIPEEPILTAKKGQRLLHTHKICIRGIDGATKYLLGISEDITERKQAETEIAKQLDELRRWQAVTLGREGRVLEVKKEVNDLLERLGEPPRYPSVEAT